MPTSCRLVASCAVLKLSTIFFLSLYGIFVLNTNRTMLQQVVLKKLGRLEKLKTAISINLLCCSRDNFFLYAEPVAENIPAFYVFTSKFLTLISTCSRSSNFNHHHVASSFFFIKLQLNFFPQGNLLNEF